MEYTSQSHVNIMNVPAKVINTQQKSQYWQTSAKKYHYQWYLPKGSIGSEEEDKYQEISMRQHQEESKETLH